MEFIPTIFALVGLGLCLAVAAFVVKGAVLGLSPEVWAERWSGASFITASWHEFGRSLFLGFVAAVGAAPLSLAFFAGSEGFLSNLVFLSGLVWVTFALAIFFVGIGTNFIGYLRHELASEDRHTLIAAAQVVIVFAACLPAFALFAAYLMPNVLTILGLWLDTMDLYAKITS